MRTHFATLILALAVCSSSQALAGDGGNAFTYQGQLQQNGAAAAGPLDLVFRIYDSETDGLQVGSSVVVANFIDFDESGRFTVEIPFVSATFNGAARWLEIEVEGVVLQPRQRINPVPYATRSLEVAAVNNAALSGTYSNVLNLTNPSNAVSGTFTGSGANLSSLNASSIASGTLASGRLNGSYGNILSFLNLSNQFAGNGSGLTSLNASNIASGTLGGSLLSGTYGNALTMTNATNLFGGNGSALTNLNASNLSSGTLNGNRLSGAYDNPLFMQNQFNVFGGIGAGLTQLNASNVSSGTLNAARLPAGGAWPLTSALELDSTTLVVDAPNNRVGIGTSAPQVALSVVGGVNVDESNVNNGGLPSSLRFGSFSGEGISSNRVGGANHIGLDLWTNATKRLSITNDGKIGFGTATPTARLHLPATATGQAVEFPGLRVFENVTSPNVVGGHADNSLVGTVAGVTIGGGGTAGDVGSNASASDYATIGGGVGNKVDVFSTYGTVGGGLSNSVVNHFGTIAGGVENVVWETHGFIGGGANNAAKHKSAIAGGEFNSTEQLGFVGAGYSNWAGSYGVVAGGFDNTSGGYSTSIGGGASNQATGDYSTVPGGSGNVSVGQYSLAGGRNARANHNGAFVWSDSTAPATPFASSGADQFLILANGGVGINTNAPTSSLQVNGGIRARGGSPGGSGSNNNGFAFAGNGGDNDSGMFSSVDGQLEFYSNANELIRITPSGNVGIGTTNPTSKFEVNGSAAKPGGGLWSVSSDARLKKNVAPLEHSLEDLMRLHGVTYEYIDPAAINELDGTRIGFIAQNVEEVFPDWVDFGPNGFRRLTIRGFEAVAVEAIRELREEKDAEIARCEANSARPAIGLPSWRRSCVSSVTPRRRDGDETVHGSRRNRCRDRHSRHARCGSCGR
jgi:hypothetical protein